MAEGLTWHECTHCKMKSFCSDAAQKKHEDGCPDRKKAAERRKCPRCHSPLRCFNFIWTCFSSSCGFTVEVLKGGRVL